MSKITICKGNIIMTSKGDTTFHTFDGSIVSTAGGSNYWGGEQGTIVGDYEPMELPNKTSIPIIKSKCLVHFRPHNDWKGEYGFDWFRTGDTGMKGDNDFNKIIGYYYESNAKDAEKFPNAKGWNDECFRINEDLRKKHIEEFKIFTCSEFKDEEYIVPKMTLLKGKTACLRFIVQKKEKDIDGDITFNFVNSNAYEHFQLDCNQLKLSNIEQDCNFEITCTKEIQSKQILRVYLDGKVCGMLEIYPNKREFQKQWNIQIVRVYDNVPTEKTDIKKEETDAIERVFNQALVKIHINEEKHKLKMNFKYVGKKKIDVKDLEKKLTEKYMRDYMKNRSFERVVFMVEGESSSGDSGQTPYGLGFSICFSDRNKETTIAHELLHSFNLLHTFTSAPQRGYGIKAPQKKHATKASDEGKVHPIVVYQAKKTDNIMDYSDNRFALYYWQWKMINKNISKDLSKWEE